MRKQLLFVTYQSEDLDEGLSYAIELAKAMSEDLAILLAHKNKFLNRFEQLMSAISFAEEGDHGTAREIISVGPDDHSADQFSLVVEKCRKAGIAAKVYAVTKDAVSAIKDFLKQKNSVDMVLLSPSVTENGNISSGELQRLVRTASRPVVTMAKQFSAV